MAKTRSVLMLLMTFFIAVGGYSNPSRLDSILAEASAYMYTNPQKTIAIGDSLLAIQSLTDEQKLQVHICMVNGYSSQRNYEKSLEHGKLAEKLVKTSTNVRSKIQVYQVIGSQYHGLKMYNQAIAYFDLADALIPDLSDSADIALSSGYINLSRAFIYRDQMGCDVALSHFQKAIADYSSLHSSKPALRNLSIAYYNKGNCEYYLQMTDAAEKSYQAAIQAAEVNEAWSLAAFAQKGLAILYSANGEYQQSLELLDQAMKNSQNVGDPLLNQAVLKAIADNYLQLGDWDKFEEYSFKTGGIQQGIIKNQRNSITSNLNRLAGESEASVQSAKKSHRFTIALMMAAFVSIGIAATIAFKTGKRNHTRLRERIIELQSSAKNN